MKVQYKDFEDLLKDGYTPIQRLSKKLIEEGEDTDSNLEVYPNGENSNVKDLPDVIYSNLGIAAKDPGCRYRQYGIHYGPGSKLFNVQK